LLDEFIKYGFTAWKMESVFVKNNSALLLETIGKNIGVNIMKGRCELMGNEYYEMYLNAIESLKVTDNLNDFKYDN